MSVDNLTLKEIKELLHLLSNGPVGLPKCEPHPYVIGGMYLFRTVTMAITGRVLSVGRQEIVVTEAAWIADTGRYMNAVATGEFLEVEPYPDDREVLIGRASLIDAVQIPQLPRKQK